MSLNSNSTDIFVLNFNTTKIDIRSSFCSKNFKIERLRPHKKIRKKDYQTNFRTKNLKETSNKKLKIDKLSDKIRKR